ncbi:MBL fold metallo-hydrolase [Virgisporangium aliadipatigenens]|uniref:MBL fold metallo-hydrolase n=1 Tax=Virgisporangium aliadipatigenens TaxID=741659 RepID=A0A8J3YQI0_9ACTN|nr:MBL fold metallo-hydrolase [Virgisporangium aliadipatigenens]GIJ48150.1 MBL fold metallo-hydrolase [Virgisporangium aliadipatigenens]
MNTAVSFLGAARTVTGSRFAVTAPSGRTVLVDCGMYQGARELRRRNWSPFPLRVEGIDAVVLSHAHLDHCGWLPRLVRHGYHGPVLCSPRTAEVAAIVLRDAAHLQEEDAAHATRRGSSRHTPALPLFDTADAEKAIDLFRPVPFDRMTPIGADARVRLRPAGHILGSSTVELESGGRTVVFSGDLGRDDHPLLCPPQPPPAADAVVVESTYGDRRHPPRTLHHLAEHVERALARGGTVLVPAFAVDRTAVLLMALRDLMRSGALPTVPVYVDSPMAQAALEVYRAAVRAGDLQIRDEVRGRAHDPFDPGELRLAHSPQESAALDRLTTPSILVSASGMATGGRVLHHLVHLAPNARNLILLPGFQVPGTRGRAMLDGAAAIKIFGEYVPVRAEVAGLDDLSAHADAEGLLAWLRGMPAPPHTCYVVHGEPAAAAALTARIRHDLGWCAVVPELGERVLVQGRAA